MIEWEVYFADGSRMSSLDCIWEDLPDNGIQVVRTWSETGQKWVNYGDSVYGKPGTWKNGRMIEQEVFDSILAIAQSNSTKPSERE